ncbi:hypothetical protein D778_00470 [Xanthomarina gelatinilytica]|uniref:Uncharacterized protein n=1 Tax=Xanthomarina gelatinilytica TaxID=1137281 RepID=M7MEA3_9FLAO|nr:hypothetical protein D778_00470 [Xanthomarina gelatinilytica]
MMGCATAKKSRHTFFKLYNNKNVSKIKSYFELIRCNGYTINYVRLNVFH